MRWHVKHVLVTLGSVVLSVIACSEAQTAVLTQTPPPFGAVGGSFFALSVADLDLSTKWYVEKFGLAVKMEIPKNNGVAGAILEGGGLTVELNRRDDAIPLSQTGVTTAERVHGVYKVGFTVDQFDATVANLRSRGVEVVLGPFPASSTQRANVIVKDNAGTLLQLFGR
jgi:catechol 2,3-dioxygenase-like lactoylglutathione lyase family enzyme